MSRRLLFALLGDRAGTAVIEFAFALPILCVMVFGMYEVAQAVICYYKLVDAANSVADLIGQTTTAEGGLGQTDFNNFYTAGQLIMSPNSGATLKLDIASVTYNAAGAGASVGWQIERGGAGSISSGTLTSAASTLGVDNGSVIIVMATYTYTSALNYFIKTPITMTFQSFASPRNMLKIPCPPSGSGESCS